MLYIASMDARKQFLLEVAETSRDVWLKLGTEIFASEIHLETSNTVYRFLDGACYTIAKKGGFDRPRRDPSGLRLIGWLVQEEDGSLALSLHAKHGAPAVLWRPSRKDEHAFVFTSATLTLAKSHRDEREEAQVARSAQKHVDPQSIARIFIGANLAFGT